jgi:hypothetical protein
MTSIGSGQAAIACALGVPLSNCLPKGVFANFIEKFEKFSGRGVREYLSKRIGHYRKDRNSVILKAASRN